MMRTALAAVLMTPPVRGLLAPVLSVAALAVPTAILSLDHSLPAGACCTTYFPFVLLTAVLARPVYAAVVGIGSAGLADAMFMGPRYQLFETPMDDFAWIASLASFALIIVLIQLFRHGRQNRIGPDRDEGRTGIIFSLESGQAWATWQGSDAPVRLGPQKEVELMMEDFLLQLALGKRLIRQADESRRSNLGAETD